MKTKMAKTKVVDYLKAPYGRVVFPEADGTFRAEIVEFPGCIATGDTAVDALHSLERVAEGWLESTLARGQAVPSPSGNVEYSGKLVLRLPKSTHQTAARIAALEGVSLNQFIVSCVCERIGFKSAVTRCGNPPTG